MRREGVLERSWEQGWHPGWASWERSELSGMLAVTENPSNKTLCTSLRHCLVCAQLLLRSHTAVQEPTWEEEAALVGSHGSVFQQDLIQLLACLPVATSVLPVWWCTTGKDGMLGRWFPVSLRKACGVSWTRLPRMQFFLLLPSLEGRGPSVRALWACLCLLTSLPFSPLTRGMYLFARGAFSESRVRLSHKPPWDPDLLINYLYWLWLISLQLVGNLVAALSVALLT